MSYSATINGVPFKIGLKCIEECRRAIAEKATEFGLDFNESLRDLCECNGFQLVVYSGRARTELGMVAR